MTRFGHLSYVLYGDLTSSITTTTLTFPRNHNPTSSQGEISHQNGDPYSDSFFQSGGIRPHGKQTRNKTKKESARSIYVRTTFAPFISTGGARGEEKDVRRYKKPGGSGDLLMTKYCTKGTRRKHLNSNNGPKRNHTPSPDLAAATKNDRQKKVARMNKPIWAGNKREE